MKRYCVPCKQLVDATQTGRHSYDACGICGSTNVRFTLRQGHWLEQHFTARLGGGEQVPIKRDMLNRGGTYGWIDSVSPEGLNLWFDEGESGVEAWQWGELEVEHLLPDDLELDIVVPPSAAFVLHTGDRLLMKDGKVAHITWQKRTRRGKPIKFAISGPDVIGPRAEVSQKTLGRVLDYLRVDI